MLQGAGVLPGEAAWGGAFKRTTTQAGSAGVDNAADFNVDVDTPCGVVRQAAGAYRLQRGGIWLVTAQVTLSFGVDVLNPYVRLYDDTLGEVLVYQEAFVAALVTTNLEPTNYSLTLATTRRFRAGTVLKLLWNYTDSSCDLVATGGTGCEIGFRYLSP